MKCIISPFQSCYQNIASEEYYVSTFDEDMFYLYINSPCIVIGKHQNAYSEINLSYVEEHQIDVVRRQSGGGAVYHDHGNLNYGFITKNKGQGIDAIFREFTQPIINVLQSLGANANFSGRNDLVIDEQKISGVAQFHSGGKVLLHGTLLFDTDLSKVSASLNADPRKFQDKSVKSVKSRVTNIRPVLPTPISIEDFLSIIAKEVVAQFPAAKFYTLSDPDKAAIQHLADTKYSTWEWVYGSSPDFTYTHALKYEKGLLDIGLVIQHGRIQDLRLFGDFFGKKEVNDLRQKLIGIPYQRSKVEDTLSDMSIDDYVFGLTNEQFLASLFDSSMK